MPLGKAAVTTMRSCALTTCALPLAPVCCDMRWSASISTIDFRHLSPPPWPLCLKDQEFLRELETAVACLLACSLVCPVRHSVLRIKLRLRLEEGGIGSGTTKLDEKA